MLQDQSTMVQSLKTSHVSLNDQFQENKRNFMEILDKIKDNPIEMMENRKQISVAQVERANTQASLENTKNVVKQYETLMTKYQTFEKKTEEIIPKLFEKYNKEWKISAKEWYNWSIETTTSWFAYVLTKNTKNIDNSYGEIDFDSIKLYLEKISFEAKYLSTIDDSDLSKYGFKNEDDCDLLYQNICDLIEKYPLPKKRPKKLRVHVKAVEFEEDNKYEEKENSAVISNNGDKEEIEQKYLCPISQKLMKNPVIAFNGVTYEKENIVKYLNNHGAMPNNNEKVCNVKMAINDLTSNRVLKQEIKENITGDCNKDVEQEEAEDFDIDLITAGGCDPANENEKEKQDSDGDNQEPPKKRQRIE